MSDPRFGCYIGNVDASISLETLKQCFAQCGRISNASLNGKDTDPYRYGFIDFTTEAERDKALAFNGFTLAGRALKVGVSKGTGAAPRERQPVAPPMPQGAPYAAPYAQPAPGFAAAPQQTRPWRSANEPPSAELVHLRDIQKKQFLSVVRKQGEKYLEKTGGKRKRSRSPSKSSSSSGVSSVSEASGKKNSRPRSRS